jgi:hypothetical protein
VLYGVQAKLRSGDVWVPGSRRYTDPTTLLIPAETWVTQRDDFCTVTGTDADPTRQLQRLDTELHAAVTELERVLTDPASEGLARVGEDGDLIVSPLPAEQVPAEAAALADAVAARLPQIHLPALLIEVDRDTRFSEAFTHAGGAQPRNPDLIRNLYLLARRVHRHPPGRRPGRRRPGPAPPRAPGRGRRHRRVAARGQLRRARLRRRGRDRPR